MWIWSECLSVVTIHTNNGIKYIKDLSKSDTVVSNKNGHLGYQKTDGVMKKSTKGMKFYKLKTKTREIICSENHRFFTCGRDTNMFNRNTIATILSKKREVLAKNLRVQDTVLVAYKIPEPIKPKKFDKNWSQLLGYIASDGTFEFPTNDGIKIDDMNLDCLLAYQKLSNNLGFSTSMLNYPSCYRLRMFGKKKIIELIKPIKSDLTKLKTTHTLNTIPQAILSSSNEVLAGFLAAYVDGDGAVQKTKVNGNVIYTINIVCKRRETLDLIKQAFLRFGIDGVLRKVTYKYKGGYLDGYRLEIKDSISLYNFKKHIPILHPEKIKRLDDIKFRKDKTRMRKIYGDIQIQRITSIEKVKPPKMCYDISVPETENFIADGFIVHNSTLNDRKKRVFINNILRVSRKRQLTYAFTCQSIDQLPDKIRKVLDLIAVPSLNRKETMCKLDFYAGPKGRTKLKTLYFPTAPVKEMYSTNEEIENLQDDVMGSPSSNLVDLPGMTRGDFKLPRINSKN